MSADGEDQRRKADIIGMLGQIERIMRWLLKQEDDQLKMQLWTVNTEGSRQTCLESSADEKGERKSRLRWGAIADMSNSTPKNSKGFGGGFGGGFGTGNRSFRFSASTRKAAGLSPVEEKKIERAATSPVKHRGFQVARSEFRFPPELLDPDISDEKRREILEHHKGHKRIITTIGQGLTEEASRAAMNDKAKDLHSGDLDALKKAVKGLNANIGYADIFYQNLCLRKLPDKKGWNVKTGWIISKFVSLKSITHGLRLIKKNCANKSAHAILNALKCNFDIKSEDKEIDGRQYTVLDITAVPDWDALSSKYPGISKTIHRLQGFDLLLTDRHRNETITEATYDGLSHELRIHVVVDPEGENFVWYRRKEQGGKHETIPCLNKGGDLKLGDWRCKEAIRVSLEKVSIVVMGVNFKLPSINFLLYRKIAISNPINGVRFAQLEVRPFEMHHTFMSSLLGWMLGIEKLFEYYIDTYRCTFGLHWDGSSTDDEKSQGTSDDDLESMWDVPGVFTVTFESNMPLSKNETMKKLLEKQVRKQKYLEVQALLLRIVMIAAAAVKSHTAGGGD